MPRHMFLNTYMNYNFHVNNGMLYAFFKTFEDKMSDILIEYYKRLWNVYFWIFGYSYVNIMNTWFIYLFWVLRRFQHCTGHITTGSFVGRGNQYIQLVSRFSTVNYQPMASNYQLSHLRPCREPNPGLRGGKRECYHSATVAPNKYKRKRFWLGANRT